MEMEYKISHIRGCFEINSDFYFCTFLHILHLHYMFSLNLSPGAALCVKLPYQTCERTSVNVP